jgi:hypothetical protein
MGCRESNEEREYEATREAGKAYTQLAKADKELANVHAEKAVVQKRNMKKKRGLFLKI